MFKDIFIETAELDNPQVLLPLATQGAVNILLEYFKPRSLICMNRDRKELVAIQSGCYKLPANFLRDDSRVSLIMGAFDLAYLPDLSPVYWYLSYQYVGKGGYLVGNAINKDKRFARWLKAVNAENDNIVMVK